MQPSQSYLMRQLNGSCARQPRTGVAVCPAGQVSMRTGRGRLRLTDPASPCAAVRRASTMIATEMGTWTELVDFGSETGPGSMLRSRCKSFRGSQVSRRRTFACGAAVVIYLKRMGPRTNSLPETSLRSWCDIV